MTKTTQELSNDSSSLLEFLQVVTEQFKRVLDTQKFILETFKNKQKSNSVYDLRDVWTKMQIVVRKCMNPMTVAYSKSSLGVLSPLALF